jgi:hypothetical protein
MAPDLHHSAHDRARGGRAQVRGGEITRLTRAHARAGLAQLPRRGSDSSGVGGVSERTAQRLRQVSPTSTWTRSYACVVSSADHREQGAAPVACRPARARRGVSRPSSYEARPVSVRERDAASRALRPCVRAGDGRNAEELIFRCHPRESSRSGTGRCRARSGPASPRTRRSSLCRWTKPYLDVRRT